jgi:NitT/TauT family transport system permease protein
MVYGIITMILIIVMTDQLLWRPVIAWSDKFKFENVESSNRVTSPVLYALRNSNVLGIINRHTFRPAAERFYAELAQRRDRRHARPTEPRASEKARGIFFFVVVAVVLAATGLAAFHAVLLLRGVRWSDFFGLLEGAAATFLRVNAALLIASLWTIPVGVAIGFHPKLSNIAQPVAQVAASFPATALFPVILLGLMRLGLGLSVGSVALMLLAAQWYILFNVIAGATAIPSDLKEVSTLFRFTSVQRWTTVILPGIFPFLITGLVTASGGAWNASIVTEYFKLKDTTLKTVGLGAQISSASDSGNFPMLLLATIIMALMVVTINRLVWRPLYRLAETRYRLDG